MLRKILALAVLVALGFGCVPENAPTSGKTSRGIYLTTHEHDGHKFVVATGREAGPSIIHHPACDCLKAATK